LNILRSSQQNAAAGYATAVGLSCRCDSGSLNQKFSIRVHHPDRDVAAL